MPPRGNPLSMDALQLYASDSDSDTGEFTARSLKKHRCQQVEDLIADRNAVHALPKQSPRRPLPSPPPEFLKSFPDLGTLAVLVLNPLFMFLFDSPVCKVFHFVCFLITEWFLATSICVTLEVSIMMVFLLIHPPHLSNFWIFFLVRRPHLFFNLTLAQQSPVCKSDCHYWWVDTFWLSEL